MSSLTPVSPSSIISSSSSPIHYEYGLSHLRDLTLVLTHDEDKNTITSIFHVNRSILAHACTYFEHVTQDTASHEIPLPSPFRVDGYTVTPHDMNRFLMMLYDHEQCVTMEYIDGYLALSLYFDCTWIRSRCDTLFTSTVETLISTAMSSSTCQGPTLIQYLDRAVRFRLTILESTCIREVATHYVTAVGPAVNQSGHQPVVNPYPIIHPANPYPIIQPAMSPFAHPIKRIQRACHGLHAPEEMAKIHTLISQLPSKILANLFTTMASLAPNG